MDNFTEATRIIKQHLPCACSLLDEIKYYSSLRNLYYGALGKEIEVIVELKLDKLRKEYNIRLSI